ncbi:MAG: cell division protein FtsL [Thermodesulfobacteriota bacterium]|nr:cell division protein FtsL [Thermodesulfobacteriota bacterium]
MSARHDKKKRMEVKFSTVIIVSLVLMATALIYVWSHLHSTKLNYLIAEEISIRDNLLEKNKKLKLEYATLRSPQRIESIARNKLDMYYPERGQVVFVK